MKKEEILETSDEDEIPNYSNWEMKKPINVKINPEDEKTEEKFEIPDYSKWKFEKEIKGEKKKEETKSEIFEKSNLSKEKIDLFKDILKDKPEELKFEKKKTNFSFLSNQIEESDDEDENLSYDDWKKKKFENEKKPTTKKPLDFMKMIEEMEQKNENLKPQMNKEEHQKFVSNSSSHLVGMDVSIKISQINLFMFCLIIQCNTNTSFRMTFISFNTISF